MAAYQRPTIGRRILGKKLQKAREAAGLSVEQVSRAAGQSEAATYRQESGATAVKETAIPFFANQYGIDDPEEIDRLKAWCKIAKIKGTWGPSGTQLGPTFNDYADAESFSSELRFCELLAVPGLLQTEEYSTAIIRRAATVHPGELPSESTLAEIEEKVRMREARKALLKRDDPKPPRIWAVLGEAAVRTPPRTDDGGRAHKEQIQHLLNLGEGIATIQVLPLAAGLHSATSGSFSVMTIGDVELIHREGYAADGSFIDSEAQVRDYRARYERLQVQALNIERSRKFLHDLLARGIACSRSVRFAGLVM
ncbi:helix-turn-helix domain-containing protein [Streptomyces sp. NPDC059761]|uniref:helix-turn-helix domain-containing protein n=1 Tax=Streptomyces sp. NPDC059761 TaxID=3346937 RepID=UPI0036593097